MDFVREIGANHTAVFLNYFFWQQHDFSAEDVSITRRDEVLHAMTNAWNERGSAVAPLGIL